MKEEHEVMERSLVRSEARELGVIDVVTNDVGYQLPRHPTLLDAPHSNRGTAKRAWIELPN